jgi:membrane-associated phospholipid phosphatase
LKEFFKNIDYNLFELINQKGNIPLLNQVFMAFRNPVYLRYLYISILFLLIIKYRLKGLWVAMFMAATMGLSDLISSHFFKVYFMRLRPCMDDRWLGKINLLVGCPHGFSFTSSHAANNMSVCFFMMLLFAPYLKQLKYLILLFPCLVGYSQIYVGVHYPIDVTCGLLLGACCGGLMYYLYQKYLPKAHQINF